MHKNLPNLFIFLDKYNSQLFKNNNINVGIIYRNYSDLKNEKELFKIAKACKKKGYKLYVSNNIRLATKVKADGIYIPAFNKTKKFFNLENKKFKVLGSAHNHKEIQEKILQKCSAIFLSPVFYVKKSKTFLNIHKFNSISNAQNIDIFALGGIKESNINKLKLLKIKGFGAISLFKKKPAFKRPVFLKNNFF